MQSMEWCWILQKPKGWKEEEEEKKNGRETKL